MKKISLLLVLCTGLITSSTFADTTAAAAGNPDWTWVTTLSVGPAWESAGNTQTFYLTPEIEKSYVANKSTKTLLDGEVFLGIQKALSQNMQGQLGVAVAATSDANLSGVIWDDADPEFDNFTYNYKIQHTHVALKGKLLAEAGLWFTPWLSGSLGVGFNRAYSFNNEPIIWEAVKTPNFSSHTQVAFTYTIGVGIQKALDKHYQIGLGYEFADWGKSQLGRAAEQTLNQGLTLNHLYTSAVLLNLTYLA